MIPRKCPRKTHFNTQWGGGSAQWSPGPPAPTALNSAGTHMQLHILQWTGIFGCGKDKSACKVLIFNSFVNNKSRLGGRRVQKPHVRNKSNLSYWIVNTMYLTPHILFVVIVKNFCCVIAAWGGIMKKVLRFLSWVFLCLHIFFIPNNPLSSKPLVYF